MTYRFLFQDQYNGEYELIGCGETEEAAIRNAADRSQRNYPLSVGGACYLVHPYCRSLEEVTWLQSSRRWRVTYKRIRGDYAGLTFSVWSERGSKVPNATA